MKSKRFYYINKISEVFIQYGISNLTVDEVADKIGVTKKTLYNYFESKQQMVESFLDYISMKQKTEISSVLSKNTNPIETLIMMTKSIFNLSQTYHKRLEADIMPRYQESLQNIIYKRRSELLEFITFNFNKGVHLGLFESDIDIQLTSRYYLFEMENLFLSQYRFMPLVNGENEIDQLLYYQLKGMCTPRGQLALRESINFKVSLVQQA